MKFNRIICAVCIATLWYSGTYVAFEGSDVIFCSLSYPEWNRILEWIRMSISRISTKWFKEFSHPSQWQHCCIISYYIVTGHLYRIDYKMRYGRFNRKIKPHVCTCRLQKWTMYKSDDVYTQWVGVLVHIWRLKHWLHCNVFHVTVIPANHVSQAWKWFDYMP